MVSSGITTGGSSPGASAGGCPAQAAAIAIPRTRANFRTEPRVPDSDRALLARCEADEIHAVRRGPPLGNGARLLGAIGCVRRHHGIDATALDAGLARVAFVVAGATVARIRFER